MVSAEHLQTAKKSRTQYANPMLRSRDFRRVAWSQAPLLFLLAVLISAVPLLAQSPPKAGVTQAKSPIEGVVAVQGTNGQPAALEGITLKLTGVRQAKTSVSTLTDEMGHYEFNQLNPGRYELEAHADGMEPYVKPVLLGANELHVENVVLHIQPVVQKVEIRDQASPVGAQVTASTSQLNERQFRALPLAEQEFKQALPLIPGGTYRPCVLTRAESISGAGIRPHV